jgi:hypothetical protein
LIQDSSTEVSSPPEYASTIFINKKSGAHHCESRGGEKKKLHIYKGRLSRGDTLL